MTLPQTHPDPARTERPAPGGEAEQQAKREVKQAARFWTKVNEDWALNFAGMLAYNYLTAIAPILLALLAVSGLVLGVVSPATYNTFVVSLAGRFPAGAGHTVVNATLTALRQSAGILLAIAIITAIFSGSRLFVALDNVFAVIFRVDVRPFLKQNIMAILMMLLFLVLAPISFFAASVPGAVLSFVLPSGAQSNGFVLTVEGFVGGLAVAFIMFSAIYFVVPNRTLSWSATWPGALVTAFLLNIYEVLFPIYQRIFLKSASLGSVAGLAVVILIFLYYIGVITLIGAEINAWVSGLRPLGATLPELFRQERLEGVGGAPHASSKAGAASVRANASQRPAGPLVVTPRALRGRGARNARQRDERPQQAPATGKASGKSTGKIARIARPAAAVTTVAAMLGAGAALALRRMSRPAQPTT